jgi:hypothetical protein
MMEWNDIGIKEAEDVVHCLREGATAFDLHDSYGSRIAGLIADACDLLQAEVVGLRGERDSTGELLNEYIDKLKTAEAEVTKLRALALDLYRECRGDRIEGTWEELMKRAKTELSKSGVSCD